MKKIILLFLLASSIFFVSSILANPKVIKLAAEATYPPYVYTDTVGHVEGFDADIVRSLCKQMHATCLISNQPWDSLIPNLKLGKFDALFGGIAITTARQKEVDFTHPYYTNRVSFVGYKNAHLNLSKESLQGKVIGVQGGTTFEIYLQEKYGKRITIQRYPSEQEALMDLVAGRIDAVVGDTPVIKQWLKQNNGRREEYILIGNSINDPFYFGEGDGIAVKKGNLVLVNALNNALTIIKVNRTYFHIVKKYFGNN